MTRPGIASIERALWAMPEAEHAAFAQAILERAREWTAAGATGRERPSAWPVRIQVQQEPRAD